MRSIFGSFIRRKSTFQYKKVESERETKKQKKIWEEFVQPTLKIFEESDFKSWWNVCFNDVLEDEGKEGKSVDKASDIIESLLEAVKNKELDPSTGAKPTAWTPAEKLHKYMKLKQEIAEVNARVETVFHSVGNPNPVKQNNEKTEGVEKESDMGEGTEVEDEEKLHERLKQLSLHLVETQEQIYKALMSRYPFLHRLRVDPGRITIYHYAKLNPCLYRQNGKIGDKIRSRLWEVASLAMAEKFLWESKTNKKGYYKALLDQTIGGEVTPKQKLVYEQIEKDIHRTLAGESFFTVQENCLKLRNILKCFSIHHPKIGYCQSMNFVAAGLLMVLKDEETAFYVFSRLIIEIMPENYYSLSMAGVVTDVQVLTKLLKVHLPHVEALLNKLGVTLDILCCPILMSLCFGATPIAIAQRCMDLVLLEGSHVLVCVVLAMLSVSRMQILAQDDPGDMMLVLTALGKDLDESVYEEFFSCVYHFIDVAGTEIHKLRGALADSVRQKQEKLLQNCFIQLNDGGDDSDRNRISSAPVTPRPGDGKPDIRRSISVGSPKSLKKGKIHKVPIVPEISLGESSVKDEKKRPETKLDRKRDSSESRKSGQNRSLKRSNGRPRLSSDPAKINAYLRSKDNLSTPSNGGPWMSKNQMPIDMQNLQVLRKMGFSLKDSRRACLAMNGQTLQETINWLLRHMAETNSAAVAEASKSSESLPVDGLDSINNSSTSLDPEEEKARERRKRREKRRQKLRVTVPKGVSPGQLIQVRTPYGRLVRVRVPKGLLPGSKFLIDVSVPKRRSMKQPKKSKKPARPPIDNSSSRQSRSGSSSSRKTKRYLRFTVPQGMKPGQTITVATPEGNKMQLALPEGATPGKQLRVEYTLKRSSRHSGSTKSSKHTRDREHRKPPSPRSQFGWEKMELECLQKPFGMTIEDGTVIVTRVKGAAMELGVLPGDRLLSVAGVQIDASSWREVYVAATPPFKIVVLTPHRRTSNSSQGSAFQISRKRNIYSVEVCEIPFGITCKGMNGAVVVRNVQGEAGRCGIRAGDILVGVAGRAVQPTTWMDVFRKASQRMPFTITLRHLALIGESRRSSSQLNPKLSQTTPKSSDLVELKFDPNQPIGLELQESEGRLLIQKTVSGTQANGKVKVGWQLLRISGRSVKSRREVKEAMKLHLLSIHTKGTEQLSMTFSKGLWDPNLAKGGKGMTYTRSKVENSSNNETMSNNGTESISRKKKSTNGVSTSGTESVNDSKSTLERKTVSEVTSKKGTKTSSDEPAESMTEILPSSRNELVPEANSKSIAKLTDETKSTPETKMNTETKSIPDKTNVESKSIHETKSVRKSEESEEKSSSGEFKSTEKLNSDIQECRQKFSSESNGHKWEMELKTMKEMGLTNREKNLDALIRADGKLEKAISDLTSNNPETGRGSLSSRSISNAVLPPLSEMSSAAILDLSSQSLSIPSKVDDMTNKLAQLRGMGFDDEKGMKEALTSAGGNVEMACAMLLSEQSQS